MAKVIGWAVLIGMVGFAGLVALGSYVGARRTPIPRSIVIRYEPAAKAAVVLCEGCMGRGTDPQDGGLCRMCGGRRQFRVLGVEPGDIR